MPVDRAGRGTVCEVYPAASRSAWGLTRVRDLTERGVVADTDDVLGVRGSGRTHLQSLGTRPVGTCGWE